MTKINNPMKADILPYVVRLYAEKLNKEYKLFFNVKDAKIISNISLKEHL
jgi:hypothetical protein